MEIQIERVDNAFKLKATNDTGHTTFTDGSLAIGGSQEALRPMQLLLTSLAGCSAIDVISILNKQRQTIDSFKMTVKGERKEGIPSPFKKIDIVFILKGKIKEEKLIKAINLTKGKYCSVYFSLHPNIEINYSYSLNED